MTRFDKAVNNVILSLQNPVSLQDIIKRLQVETGESVLQREKDILDRINHSRYLFRLKNRYIPRNSYFHEARFLIRPTDWEIKNSLLIPAGRFSPFCNPRLFTMDLVPLADYGRIYTKQVFLDKGFFKDWVLMPLDGEWHDTVTAWDFRSFYQNSDFRPGDVLAVTVLSWDEGLFLFEKSRSHGKKSLNQLFKTSLENVVREKTGPFYLEEQISRALFFMGRKIFRSAQFLLEDALDEASRSLERHQHHFHDVFTLPGQITIHETVPEHPDTLDSLIRKYQSFLDRELVEAFIRDSFYKGAESFEEAWNRILLFLPDDGSLKLFKTYIQPLWKDLRSDYNVFKDRDTGPIRSFALSILEKHYLWLKYVRKSEQLQNCSGEFCDEWGRLEKWVREFVILLNEENFLKNTEISEAMDALENIEYGIASLETRFPVTERTKVVNFDLFIIKIRSKEISGDFIIEGSASLRDLHRFFKNLIGSENDYFRFSHMRGHHDFDLYGPEESGDSILDLGIDEGDTLLYQYDDQLTHEIKIRIAKGISNSMSPFPFYPYCLHADTGHAGVFNEFFKQRWK